MPGGLHIDERVTLEEFELADRDERGVLLFKAVLTQGAKLDKHIEDTVIDEDIKSSVKWLTWGVRGIYGSFVAAILVLLKIKL